MIEVVDLTKRYGDTVVVDSLSFEARPGRVTGFLGPNGAGKSTTMRMLLGLDRPESGHAWINGRPFAAHPDPLRQVGALLEARATHPSRSARNHLRALAATLRLADRRVDEVIELAGLGSVADRRVGSFSLGMGQRLGIAAAMLGDPAVLILDEPVNGLDPDGVQWIRTLLRALADEGRTVLLSSHLMSEMALTADDVVVIGRGRLLRVQPMTEFIASTASARVLVRSPELARLRSILAAADVAAESFERDGLLVEGRSLSEIGNLAARAGVALHELSAQNATLEQAYMALTSDAVDYAADRDRHSMVGSTR